MHTCYICNQKFPCSLRPQSFVLKYQFWEHALSLGLGLESAGSEAGTAIAFRYLSPMVTVVLVST